jgi:hypothetical protein
MFYCGTLVVGGFQAILFSLLSRMYAIQEGIYPKNAQDVLCSRFFSLERGLLAGGAMLLVGIGSMLVAVWDWRQHAFGSLDTEHIARVVFPSSVALSLGMEVILFSLLLSTFGLKVRPLDDIVDQMASSMEGTTPETVPQSNIETRDHGSATRFGRFHG